MRQLIRLPPIADAVCFLHFTVRHYEPFRFDSPNASLLCFGSQERVTSGTASNVCDM